MRVGAEEGEVKHTDTRYVLGMKRPDCTIITWWLMLNIQH